MHESMGIMIWVLDAAVARVYLVGLWGYSQLAIGR
jgi:hypothetical protein